MVDKNIIRLHTEFEKKTQQEIFREIYHIQEEIDNSLLQIKTSAGDARVNHIEFLKRFFSVYKESLDELFRIDRLEWRKRNLNERKKLSLKEQKLLKE